MEIQKSNAELYPHYFKKNPEFLREIDIYAVLRLFDVTDPGVAHAIKKLLVTGKRGSKDYLQDIIEARDTLNRTIELLILFGESNE